MNAETKVVADCLSTEGTYVEVLAIVQAVASDEVAAQQIADYVTQQRRGPKELYQSFAQNNYNFQNVDWIEVAQAFTSD